MSSPPIQWYPGHIAKAEQQLKRNLDKVDLVIEVRDARIPLATGHPHLNRWINGKQHLLVINRRDMVTSEARVAWEAWFKARGQRTVWCDAKAGTGVKQVQQAAIRAGDQLNERRRNRGMRPRPVRALTLGFPNVGKSALINRLVKQKVVASARRAGVTRTLRWVRLGQDLDLLDAPGVLPPRLDDQQAALHLALCDDIGQAAYDGELVAQAFLNLLKGLQPQEASGVGFCMELFHHPWVQPIPVIHSAWNRRLGSGTKTAEGSQEQGGAGHAVGVVITANGQSLPRLARRLKACKRRGELGEVVVGSRRVLIAQESLHVLCC